MQSVFGGGDSNNNENFSNYNMSDPRLSAPKSSKSHTSSHNQHQQQKSKSGSSNKNRKFKDDMSMAHSQNKEKVKANPYATIKMWRPVSNSSGATDGEVYQTFTNFDALRHDPDPDLGFASSDSFSRANGLPPTGDLGNQQEEDLFLKNSKAAAVDSQRPGMLRSPGIYRATSPSKQANPSSLSLSTSTSRQVNGFAEVPADYPMGTGSPKTRPPGITDRRVSFEEDSRQGSKMTAAPSPRHTASLSTAKSNSSVPPPLPTSPPPSLPNGFSGSRGSPRSSHNRPTTDLSATAPAAISPESNPQDNSFQVVSDGTTTSVKLVLSHSYSDVELAGRDVERLLAELKLTIDSLRTRSASTSGARPNSTKTPGQLGLCLTEFQVQTKAFVQAAKEVVSAANDSREERLLSRVQAAVHALARLFLHGQASMLMLPSASDAQRLGMQLIKATNAFKATLGAAHAAMGKSLTDPHMKYLMRQATNLAALLGALLGTIKEVQTV
ncbi:FERM and PDZ domain-containing protein 4 [Elysia marginata]|uniref:FERM and PDZ domain-containing protein 4 n=1 Tax=Elysia marginata TaxID=1093978 RepID=A0AAV4I255_9GAST|nr:FERM and PDZ domain-containing protein 4 [Elysia marginata]